MDKSLFVFVLIGVGFIYVITNFVGEIQQEDKFQNEAYKQQHQYEKYQSVDSIGREILDVIGVQSETQVKVWKHSGLKIEFLTLFPDFSEMKIFVKERVRGEELQTKLIGTIDQVESQYFSGLINAEQAKRALDLLK